MNTTRYSLLTGLCLMFGAPAVLQAQSGALDPTFNGTGYIVDPVNTLDVTQKILVQDDQKILVVGMSFDANYTAHAYAFRYLSDGTPDPAFATDGVFSYELDNEADLYSAVITSEGKIILAGSTTDYQSYRLLLIQLNADGTLDDSFGTGGVVAQSVSVVVDNAEDMGYDVALDAVGNILLCGSSFDENYVRRPIIARFTSTGVLDTDFGLDGIASIPAGTAGESAFKGILVQPDGKIVASGYFGNSELWFVMLLVRFNDDGSLDPDFGDAGVVKYNYGNVDDEGEDLKLTSDGSILVCGVTVTQTYNYSALLAKFTSDGVLDQDFGDAGTVEEDLGNFDFASNVAVLSDGSILMAGSSGVGPPGSFDQVVWKYLPDGAPDASFGINGYSQQVIPDYSTMIYGMDVQEDGKILIGGQARTTVNENYFYVARMQNDISSGIAELASSSELLIYPVPATMGSTVNLRITQVVQPDARIGLYAADGRLVFTSQAAELHRDGQVVSVQLPTDLAPGTYQLAFQQQGTRLASSLIVIH